MRHQALFVYATQLVKTNTGRPSGRYCVIAEGFEELHEATEWARSIAQDPLAGWTSDEKQRVMQYLKKSGSHFSSRIADAWLWADLSNRRRIEAEFHSLFTDFARYRHAAQGD